MIASHNTAKYVVFIFTFWVPVLRLKLLLLAGRVVNNTPEVYRAARVLWQNLQISELDSVLHWSAESIFG